MRAIAIILPLFAAVALASADHPALFAAPRFFSQAADTGVPRMLEALRGYTHAAQLGTQIPTAPQCNISHDQIAVASANLDSIVITPINGTTLEVTFSGFSGIQLTPTDFNVSCGLDGAFTAEFLMAQRGTVAFQINFAPALKFLVSLASSGGNVSLTATRAMSTVVATPTYGYMEQGFPLDMFVANYFETTLSALIQAEVAGLFTSTSPFTAAWTNGVNGALSFVQFVCGFDLVPQYNAVVMWMEPGCGPSAQVNATIDLLANRSVLLMVPSSSGRIPARVQEIRKLRVSLTCADNVPCPNPVASEAVNMTFCDCTVCFPGDGIYTEYALSVNFSSR
jgi:hypothetical protein